MSGLAALESLLESGGVEGMEELAEETERPEETERDPEEREEEPEAEEPGQPEPEPDPEETVEVDLATLAGAVGLSEGDIDLDDQGAVKIRTKVNGEESLVTLDELRKSYQLQKNLDQKAHSLNQEREQVQAWFAEQQQRAQTEASIADAMVNEQAEELAQRYQAVPWDKLREQDPAEWAARRQEFTTAYNQLRERKARIHQRMNEESQKQMQQMGQQRQQALMKEAQALAERLPEWNDQQVATREKQQLAEYLLGMGYAQNELDIADHRAILIARKAMLYDQRETATPAAKTVRKVAKVIPPGAKQTASKKLANKRTATFNRLKKTGSERDAVDLLMDMTD